MLLRAPADGGADATGGAVTQQELVQRVSWTVEPAPPEARVAGALTGLLGAVAAVVSLGSTTGAPLRPTWELPADPDEYVGLGLVRVRGQAPWLPGGTGGGTGCGRRSGPPGSTGPPRGVHRSRCRWAS
jgi:hypothetical protein